MVGRPVTSQMDLLAPLDEGLCNYGTPPSGTPDRPCSEPATHGARWSKDGATGGIDCCLKHANYYANAWCGYSGVAWIDIL